MHSIRPLARTSLLLCVVGVSGTRAMTHAAEGALQQSPQATLKAAAASALDARSAVPDIHAEEQLLQLANEARRNAGAPALELDAGLSEAARTHARAMLEAGRLSHRFDGEPSLPQRLATATQLQLEEEAENVALDSSPDRGHEHLMLSPPHRANLLNPAYNVVGLGVIRAGERLYIVQDFGHSLPNYSATELKEKIAAAVKQTRMNAGQAELQRRDLLIADEVACSMAQADKLGTPPVHKLAERFTVVTYNSLHPEMLPNSATRALGRDLHRFSLGTCFARTDTYPTGVYWVVLSLE